MLSNVVFERLVKASKSGAAGAQLIAVPTATASVLPRSAHHER